MSRAISRILFLVGLWGTVPASFLFGQDLERVREFPLQQETVQEITWMPGSTPEGWAAVGLTVTGQSSVQGVGFIDLNAMTGCTHRLDENVQDVLWTGDTESTLFATLKEAGSIDGGVAVLLPGTDPCAASPTTFETLGIPMRNATNLWLSSADTPGIGAGNLFVSNSFPLADCGGSYQRQDQAVFWWDVGGIPNVNSTLRMDWSPGMDGSGFSQSCDRCGTPICAPEDISLFEAPGGGLHMAVASLLDGVWIVDISDPANPTAVAHMTYRFEGRDASGNPLPDRINITGDIEVTPDGYLVTADQSSQGGHVLVWDLEEIMTECANPASPCVPGDVQPVGEFFPDGVPPGFAHKLLPDWPYLWATWFDYGVVLIDMSDPVNPREVDRFDVLDAHPSGSFNQWGAYGAALARSCRPGGDPSPAPADELLVSSIGVYGSAGGQDAPGGVQSIRWRGIENVAGPFRVGREPADPNGLSFTWQPGPLSTRHRIYSGTIDRLGGGFQDDHGIADPTWCSLPGNAASLPDPEPTADLQYFLLRPSDECGRLGRIDDSSAGPRRDPEPTSCN